LAEARKVATIKRWGLGFTARLKPDGKVATLREVAKLLPQTDGVDLRQVPNVNDAWLAELKAEPGLRHLFLEKSAVTDKGLVHVAAMKGLETLDVRDAGGVTDAGLASLAGLTEMRH